MGLGVGVKDQDREERRPGNGASSRMGVVGALSLDRLEHLIHVTPASQGGKAFRMTKETEAPDLLRILSASPNPTSSFSYSSSHPSFHTILTLEQLQ